MESLFEFNVSPLELVARGTLMFWFLLLIFRFVLRRDMGAIGVPDVLFIVIVADAAQNGFSGSYSTVGEGMVLVGTLVAWNYLLDLGSYHFEWLRRFIEPPPLRVVRNGRVLARNLRQEHLTRDDLAAQLRQAGIESLDEVRDAFLESDGKFSFVTRDPSRRTPAKDRLPSGGGS